MPTSPGIKYFDISVRAYSAEANRAIGVAFSRFTTPYTQSKAVDTFDPIELEEVWPPGKIFISTPDSSVTSPTPTAALVPPITVFECKYGNLVNQEISPAGNIDKNIFDGKAGEQVLIAATKTSGDAEFTLHVELLDPSGIRMDKSGAGLWRNDLRLARIVNVLPVDGKYTVMVCELSDYYLSPSSQTGRYTLLLNNISP